IRDVVSVPYAACDAGGPHLLTRGIVRIKQKGSGAPPDVVRPPLLPRLRHQRSASPRLDLGLESTRQAVGGEQALNWEGAGSRVHGSEEVLLHSEIGAIPLRNGAKLFPRHRTTQGVGMGRQ